MTRVVLIFRPDPSSISGRSFTLKNVEFSTAGAYGLCVTSAGNEDRAKQTRRVAGGYIQLDVGKFFCKLRKRE